MLAGDMDKATLLVHRKPQRPQPPPRCGRLTIDLLFFERLCSAFCISARA